MTEVRQFRRVTPHVVAPRPPATRPAASRDLDICRLIKYPFAFDTFIKQHEDAIFRHAYRLAGNYDDAGDMTSETFVRIFRSLRELRQSASLSSWIGRIVNRVYIDRCRQPGTTRYLSLDSPCSRHAYARFVAPGSQSASPQAQAEAHERARILSHALTTMPIRQRAYITQYYFVGRSYQEIADAMEVPLGTVKSGLNRARAELGRRLAPERSVFID